MRSTTFRLPIPGQRPLVTVVTPTRDRLELLKRALDALGRQRDVPEGALEVVVVVDGGSDGTAEALRRLQTPFPLRVIEQVSSGVAVARNAGWRAARGEIVLFLDDDIIARPELVAEHVRMHRVHADAVVIGRFSPDTSVRRTAWTRYEEIVQEKKYAALERDELPSGIRFYSGNVSVPKRWLERVDGFDEKLVRNEDIDLGFRLQEAGCRFVFAPRADALHCGYRGFEAWRRMPLIYGRLDASIYSSRGYAGGLATIVACYHDRNPLNRLVIRLALAHPALQRQLADLFGWIGLRAYSARLEKVSYLALSALSNLLYWTGIRDGVRGNRAFWSLVRETRRRSARPYRRAAAPTAR